jgi:uncharacterized repeat protein (TIGR03847 family)
MDLGPVDRITADAVGEPGFRTFFLQARQGSDLVTVVVEKQQVQLLSASILELLADVELETAMASDDEEMGLEEPVDPRWRAGRLSIGYDDERDMFLLEISEYEPDDEEAEEERDEPSSPIVDEAEMIRLWATRAQMLALSRKGAAVVNRGRPTCQFCGNPMDPEGHACPAMNGHSKPRV